jgi:hypothetical protein
VLVFPPNVSIWLGVSTKVPPGKRRVEGQRSCHRPAFANAIGEESSDFTPALRVVTLYATYSYVSTTSVLHLFLLACHHRL